MTSPERYGAASAGAELNVRTHADYHGTGDPLAVYKRAETRVGVGHQIAPIAEPKLRVLARNHRPLLLRKEVVTDGGVAPNNNLIAGERAFTV